MAGGTRVKNIQDASTTSDREHGEYGSVQNKEMLKERLLVSDNTMMRKPGPTPTRLLLGDGRAGGFWEGGVHSPSAVARFIFEESARGGRPENRATCPISERRLRLQKLR